MTSRRNFLKITAAGTIAAPILSTFNCTKKHSFQSQNKGFSRLDLGMASYTFREFNLDDTIKMTTRLGLKKIAFKSFHLPLDSSKEEIKAVASKVRDAGLDLYGAGVIYMKNEDEVNNAFEYVKTAGMRVMIGVPNHELLEMVEKKVREYDIYLAIHNHGPGDKIYPSPESAYEKIKGMDKRMGLCLDIGHTKRMDIDPSECAEKFADRLHDVHIKDVSAAAKEGGTVEIGRGVIDIPKFLRTLLKINYSGAVSFEFEKDGKDPLPGVAESVGYVKGVLSVI
ncbi:sugar phosphate isomerase/epimerase family protein [candidate division KSB1 bacterium]